jgi:SAM-dependent methyltransferase
MDTIEHFQGRPAGNAPPSAAPTPPAMQSGESLAPALLPPRPAETARGPWAEIARRWAQLGPPLRPAAEDVAFYADVVSGWPVGGGPPRGLILGATPELYRLPWPDGSPVLAVDHTPAMIRTAWPGPDGSAVCGDWTALPLAASSRDIVLCDGGLLQLPYPHGVRACAAALARVIAPGGRFAVRLFVPPAERESPEGVLCDLVDGRIANLNVLKLRLWMALHDDVAEGVQLARVWHVLREAFPDFARLAAHLGWPLEHLLAIDAYRDCPARYHLMSQADLRRLFCEADNAFAVESVGIPGYALGERCPTIVLRRTEQSPAGG